MASSESSGVMMDVKLHAFEFDDYGEIMSSTFYSFLGGIVVLAILDFLFARNFKGRYFVLHVVANAAITITCLPDTYLVFTDTVRAVSSTKASYVPMGFVFAIHIQVAKYNPFEIYH